MLSGTDKATQLNDLKKIREILMLKILNPESTKNESKQANTILELLDAFIKYLSNSILNDNKTLEDSFKTFTFWREVLLETDLMNDLELRKEYKLALSNIEKRINN